MEKAIAGKARRAATASAAKKACAACGCANTEVFYRQKGVPVHSVLLMETKEEAQNFRRGDIALAFCERCGFISNAAYDPSLQRYSPKCEESQGFSPTFSKFSRTLAEGLVSRYKLRNKEIMEIGCGKGEFLNLLCELGENTGVGFDPAYSAGWDSRQGDRVRFVSDFYSDKYAEVGADLIVCKMTLEHVGRPGELLSAIRSSAGKRPGSALFFQVPDTTRVLYELAFWDIYYEHCSYYSTYSLRSLLSRCGFLVTDVKKDYDGQYIICEARPGDVSVPEALAGRQELESLKFAVRYFAENNAQKISIWKKKLKDFHSTGYRTVLWGSGSKAAAFLTTLGITDEVGFVVDINPYRQGTFVAGTGHEIVGPSFLRDYKPDAVIAVNPVYRDEIRLELASLELEPALITL